MRLIRFGAAGQERPGVLLDDGVRKDCSGHFSDWNRDFFAADGPKALRHLLEQRAAELPTVDEGERWGAPIARPGKVVCIGLNYSDHAAESGMAVPEEPVVFLKGSNTV
ncbi:MAG: ureidoglycolate lyase, partial [Planctomycetota bacterium]